MWVPDRPRSNGQQAFEQDVRTRRLRVVVTSPAKAKGDAAEREIQGMLRTLLGRPRIRRALGAGRKDDVGDIDGVPHTVVQVAWREAIIPTIKSKLVDVERQRRNKRVKFGVLFVRKSRFPWIVVMSPEMWAKYHKYAMLGVEAERAALASQPKEARLPPRDHRSGRARR